MPRIFPDSKDLFNGLLIILCLTVLSLGPGRSIVAHAATFIENSNATFSGTKNRTVWNTTPLALELNNSGKNNLNGTYTSLVKDAGATTTWNRLAWTPAAPYGKPLPNNKQSESAYSTGNANMAGNQALFHLDEASSSISDRSGNNLVGSVAGNTAYAQSGVFNTALNFDGVSGQATIPDNPALSLTNAITVEAWVYINSNTGTGTYPRIVSKTDYETLHENDSYYLTIPRATDIGKITFSIFSNKVELTSGFSAIIVPVGKWTHVAGVYNGSSVAVYVNGALGSSNPATGAIDPSTTPLTIGHGFVNGSSFEFFNGKIDEVGIYSRALSSTELLDRYYRGVLRIKHQVRSCSTSTCTGVSFIGPNGTATDYYSELNNLTLGTPNITLANVPNNRYFQYMTTLETDDKLLTPQLKIVTITYAEATPVTLAFNIRRNDDLIDASTCDLGTATTSGVKTCSYRLKVSTNGSQGYQIFIQTSNGLTNGSKIISEAGVGAGGSGGTEISNTNSGTERYGIVVTPGSATGGTITTNSVLNAGTNAVKPTYTTATLLLTSSGPNSPTDTDIVNTTLITHRLNISQSTPAGTYTQKVTYTVVPKF